MESKLTVRLKENSPSSIGIQCRALRFVRSDDRRGPACILDGIEAGFEAGRMALITGETGAGKSTLIHLLAGLLRPTSGEVVTDEGVVSRFTAPHRDRWRRRVGIVFQDLHLPGDWTVLESVLLRAVPRPLPWPDLLQAAHGALSQTHCGDLARQRVSRLSGGQRQRVAMARAMMGDPGYLFLDEPTAFQDDRHVADLLALWDGLTRQGVCLVVSSHDPRLRKASQFHRRWVLADGRLEPRP